MQNLKSRKIMIVISILITLIITCICTIFILKKNDKNDNYYMEKGKIQKIDDANTMYNIEENINLVLDDTAGLSFELDYDEEEIEETEQKTTNKFLEHLDIPYGSFYISELYSIVPNNNYIIYFTSGDVVYSNFEDEEYNDEDMKMEKKYVQFTLIKDIENNEYGIEFYGTNYIDIFNYTNKFENITFEKNKLKKFEPTYDLESYYSDETLSEEELKEWKENKDEIYSLYF